MKASSHVILSAGVSAGFYSQTHSWPATAACFLAGVLIDIDHHLEYCIIKKKFPFSYKDLVNFCYYNKAPKLYLILHAYEFLVIFWLLVYFLNLDAVYVGIALGLTVHMVADQFTNPINPLFYFMSYRMKHAFSKKKTLSPRYFEINRMGEG